MPRPPNATFLRRHDTRTWEHHSPRSRYRRVLTVGLQLILAALSLLFGLLALNVTLKRGELDGDRRSAAWFLTGAAFTITGSIGVVHSSWAAAAFQAGPDSSTWIEFVRWTATGNTARSLVKVAFAIALGVLALPGVRPTRAARLVGLTVLILAGVAGAAIGSLERSFSGSHYVAIAVSGVSMSMLLGAALVLHAARDTMDRLLWAAIGIYALRVALGSLLAAARAGFDAPGMIVPLRLVGDVAGVVCYLAMIVLALRYLTLERQKAHVPALLEHMRPAQLRSFT
jgi:hypothetical protein